MWYICTHQTDSFCTHLIYLLILYASNWHVLCTHQTYSLCTHQTVSVHIKLTPSVHIKMTHSVHKLSQSVHIIMTHVVHIKLTYYVHIKLTHSIHIKQTHPVYFKLGVSVMQHHVTLFSLVVCSILLYAGLNVVSYRSSCTRLSINITLVMRKKNDNHTRCPSLFLLYQAWFRLASKQIHWKKTAIGNYCLHSPASSKNKTKAIM